jgi:CubicO group peptidase (beta-lactamase class C family)
MRRIFAQELLFEPGAGREHSHSAWGVLAAILEIVSGESYQDFTRENLFEPLGMHNTGFHGDPVPESRIAIGYGFESDGFTNAPPYWGTASWLVLGSGGQVSTVGDMSRWITATLEGRLINEANTKRFLREVAGQTLNGGNAYGFEIYYTYSPDNAMILLANAVDASSRRAVKALADDLGELVLDASAPPFSLGIGMMIDDDRIMISEVRPGGGAAEPGGLLPGDIIDGIDGQPLGDDPLGIINPYLETGKAIPFDIERDGKSLRVVITPKRRE